MYFNCSRQFSPFGVGKELRLDKRDVKLGLGPLKAKRLDANRGIGGAQRQFLGFRDLVQLDHLEPQVLGVGVPDDLEEGDGHREDHEHVDHLHIGRGGQAVGDPNVAGERKLCYQSIFLLVILKSKHFFDYICLDNHPFLRFEEKST